MAYTGSSIVDYLKSVGQASDYNSRASLAAQKGITGYTGSAAQNTQLLGMLNTPAPYQPPPPTSTYNASTLSTGANPQLPALQQQLADAQAQLQIELAKKAAGTGEYATATQQNTQRKSATPPSQAQPIIDTAKAEQTSLLDRIKALFTQQEGKSTYQATEEVNAGINQQQTDIQTLTNQLNSISSESAAQQMTAEGQPIAMGFITGQQAQIQRTNAIKTLTTTALLSAKQGNLTLAQSQVDRAVALKYDPIEAELKNKMSQLELLDKYVLTPAETARKEELDREYTQQQDDLQVQKAEDTAFENNLLTAMQGGMPLDEVNQARTLYTAGNKDQANMMIAKYASTSSGGTTSDISNYNYYAQQEQAAGGTPMSFDKYTNRTKVGSTTGTVAATTQKLFNEYLPKIETFITNETSAEGKKTNWNILRNNWIKEGGSDNEFDSSFKNYNPFTAKSPADILFDGI